MSMNDPTVSSQNAMRELYDHYFASKDYDQRYPEPNRGTLDFLKRHGIGKATLALDVGCGSGRYALPLLKETALHVVGSDISASALQLFAARARDARVTDRVRLVHGNVVDVPRDRPIDAILLLFGVLSHIEGMAARRQLLRELRALAMPHTRLFVSVPNIWRRRPLELLASLRDHRRESWGDIHFTRYVGGADRTFFYHLYSLRQLRTDLASAGWDIREAQAESLLPEWLVTQSARFNRFEAGLQTWLPASFGYGIRVVAQLTQPG